MERKYQRCCACRTWKEAAILADKIKKAGGSDIDIKVRFKDNPEYGYRISWKDPENESSRSKIDLFYERLTSTIFYSVKMQAKSSVVRNRL